MSAALSNEGKRVDELDFKTLRRVAKGLGINCHGMTKDEIVQEIKRVQEDASGDGEEGKEEEGVSRNGSEGVSRNAPTGNGPTMGNPYEGMDTDEEEIVK